MMRKMLYLAVLLLVLSASSFAYGWFALEEISMQSSLWLGLAASIVLLLLVISKTYHPLYKHTRLAIKNSIVLYEKYNGKFEAFILKYFPSAQSSSDEKGTETAPDPETMKLLAEIDEEIKEESKKGHLFGEINPKLHCPHCNTTGMVRAKNTTRKTGISGGKATAAILTGGWSLLATGLSHKEMATQAHCDNCDSTWVF